MSLKTTQQSLRRLALLATCMSFAVPLAAQAQESGSPGAITSADYAHAEKFLPYNTNPLVYHAVHPVWTADERLWYRDAGPEGEQLAAALSAAAGKTYEATKLPFREIELSTDGQFVSFKIGKRQFQCDRQGGKCVVASGEVENAAASPDKKKLAFVREYNLWVRDVASGKETQLTTDGV